MTFTTFFWAVWLLSFAISILSGIFVVRKGSRASEQIELLKAIVKNQNKIICHLTGEPYVEEKEEEKINEERGLDFSTSQKNIDALIDVMK